MAITPKELRELADLLERQEKDVKKEKRKACTQMKPSEIKKLSQEIVRKVMFGSIK